MFSKGAIWVCWQEPSVDCGKTSHIPYSWVTEVLIGDGRAPGSVVKCRWPKSRGRFTAKVIAPPSSQPERSQAAITRTPSESSSDDGDDTACSSVSEVVGENIQSRTLKNGTAASHTDKAIEASADSTTTISASASEAPRLDKEHFQNRPLSKSSSNSSSARSPAIQCLDNDAQHVEMDVDGEEHQPPLLMPEIEASSYRHQAFADIDAPEAQSNKSVHSMPAHTTALSKELQAWFVLQFNSLKSELFSNFDQVNHKLAAMDLSIRSIRERVGQMEGKIDLALINSSGSSDVSHSTNQPHGSQVQSNLPVGRDNGNNNVDNNPPPMKRHCVSESWRTSFAVNHRRQESKPDEHQDRQDTCQGWTTKRSPPNADTMPTSSPPVPTRQARKSFVRSEAPISPPPFLMRESNTAAAGVRKFINPPRLMAITATTPLQLFKSPMPENQRKRRSATRLSVTYKPGASNQMIYLGGDSNFEISTKIYCDALENVYDEMPVYLILALLRRLLSDCDMSRLWFKAESPSHPDVYALSTPFAEALKTQALMQYPDKQLTEQDYITKLHQAMHDAKYRLRHGRGGSVSRPKSYFPFEMIAVPLTSSPRNHKSKSSNVSRDQQKSNPRAASNHDVDIPDFGSCRPILLGDADDDDVELKREPESSN